VQVLADVTERAWRALIAAGWWRLRSVLEADIAYRSRKLADGGLKALFGDLHSDLSWTDGTLALHTRDAVLREQDLDGRGLLLIPSVFAWPDAVSGFAPPWQPTIIYPARGMGYLWQPPAGQPPDALARLLGPNRAVILAGLNEPASTTLLAHQYRLAPSSVSAHLAVLRDAELVTAQRHGHQMLYQRTPLGTALAVRGTDDSPRPPM
jgi:hypothetical protein